ncbi:MAG: hypothetical protein R2880_17570 [Deinococcales bacterium]
MFDLTIISGILASGIRLATPYLYAAIGETIGQRSGVLNLGVDGIMLLSAFVSYFRGLDQWQFVIRSAQRHNRGYYLRFIDGCS